MKSNGSVWFTSPDQRVGEVPAGGFIPLWIAWGEKRYPSGTSDLPTTYRYVGQRQESLLGGTDGLYYRGALLTRGIDC